MIIKIKIIAILLLLSSCSNNSGLLTGHWRYMDENGDAKELIVTEDRWKSGYCYLQSEEADRWICNPQDARWKVRGDKYIKLIYGDSWRNEWAKYKIVALSKDTLILQRFNGYRGAYNIEYIRKH